MVALLVNKTFSLSATVMVALLVNITCGRFGEGLNPSPRFFIKVIVKLYVISDGGRQAAVYEG